MWFRICPISFCSQQQELSLGVRSLKPEVCVLLAHLTLSFEAGFGQVGSQLS